MTPTVSKKEQRRIRRCYWPDGAPKRCPHCISPDLHEDVRDSLDVGVGIGIPMEIETYCGKCGKTVAYWAHGWYDPCYMMDLMGVDY
nr:MAG TPA: transposase-like protein [Caudoviricetes sp.]